MGKGSRGAQTQSAPFNQQQGPGGQWTGQQWSQWNGPQGGQGQFSEYTIPLTIQQGTAYLTIPQGISVKQLVAQTANGHTFTLPLKGAGRQQQSNQAGFPKQQQGGVPQGQQASYGMQNPQQAIKHLRTMFNSIAQLTGTSPQTLLQTLYPNYGQQGIAQGGQQGQKQRRSGSRS